MPTRRVVIDHLAIGVSDLAASRAFYLAALAPLGFGELSAWSEDREDLAFGPERFDDFIISTKYPVNGGPGIRPEYSPGYYGAFVLDPDGYNVEAVFHENG